MLKKICIFLLLDLCFLMYFASLSRAIEESLVVDNISMDITSSSAKKAQEEAIALGRELAFKQLLYSMMIYDSDFERVKEYMKDNVKHLESSFSITSSKTTRVRFIGTLTYRFDRKKVFTFLDGFGLEYIKKSSSNILIVPIENGPTHSAGGFEGIINPELKSNLLLTKQKTVGLMKFKYMESDLSAQELSGILEFNKKIIREILYKHEAQELAVYIFEDKSVTLYYIPATGDKLKFEIKSFDNYNMALSLLKQHLMKLRKKIVNDSYRVNKSYEFVIKEHSIDNWLRLERILSNVFDQVSILQFSAGNIIVKVKFKTSSDLIEELLGKYNIEIKHVKGDIFNLYYKGASLFDNNENELNNFYEKHKGSIIDGKVKRRDNSIKAIPLEEVEVISSELEPIN